jgi:hypothetical protein
MLFTSTSPDAQGDRIVLYFDPEQAKADSAEGHVILGVDVALDASCRRLSIGPQRGRVDLDPDWTTAAYLEDFDRVVARDPLPDALFQARFSIESREAPCPGSTAPATSRPSLAR